MIKDFMIVYINLWRSKTWVGRSTELCTTNLFMHSTFVEPFYIPCLGSMIKKTQDVQDIAPISRQYGGLS